MATEENNATIAMKLFVEGDAKHVRAVNIIRALLDGESQIDIGDRYGMTRRGVNNLARKYLPKDKTL